MNGRVLNGNEILEHLKSHDGLSEFELNLIATIIQMQRDFEYVKAENERLCEQLERI